MEVPPINLLNINYFFDKLVSNTMSKDTGSISDGYHTFNELYDFRRAFNAALFNTWSKLGLYSVHKSKRHYDGELCFGGGWFIVVAKLPSGLISNHYELKHWDLFKVDEYPKSIFEFDGHNGFDVVSRLETLSVDSLSSDIENSISCDICGITVHYDTIMHFSGSIRGKDSSHIHVCENCSIKNELPLVNIE